MANKPSHKMTAAAGTVGGALGVLTVLFFPSEWYIFTAETASVATAAFGIVFSYAMQWIPTPKG